MGQPDTDGFSEEVLRDALAFAEQSKFPQTNVSQLRANLVILLGESSSRKSFAKELQLLSADPRSTNFILAARAVYERNREVALSNIGDPFESLGSTAIADKFEVRWRAMNGQDSDLAANRIKNAAATLQHRDFIVTNARMIAQAVGVCALIWLVFNHTKFRAARRELKVPWAGWEGLGVVCAAWILTLFLQVAFYEIVSETGHVWGLLVLAPALALLWWRHWKIDKRPLKTLFGLTPGGWCLVMAGLVLFTAVSMGNTGAYDAAHATGLKSHWAEGVYEPELYEPWRLRWIILANAVLVGPAGEELIFRGILFPALRHWMLMSAAAILSSVVFAAYHYYSWPGFFGLLVFGAICALATYLTGSLVPAIIAHILNNFFAVAGYAWIMGH